MQSQKQQGHRYHLSKFHHNILYWCFSFWLPSLCRIGSSFIHLIRTDINTFFISCVIFHCVYVPQLSYLFFCWWTSRLLPCQSYCKQCCDEHCGTGSLSILKTSNSDWSLGRLKVCSISREQLKRKLQAQNGITLAEAHDTKPRCDTWPSW